MPKISSAAADSLLLTRSLISSALNILVEDRDWSGPESVGRWESVSWSLDRRQPDRWRDQISRDPPNTTPPSSITFNRLPFTLFSIFPKFRLAPQPGEVFSKLIRMPKQFYCENKDHDFVPEGRNWHSKGSWDDLTIDGLRM